MDFETAKGLFEKCAYRSDYDTIGNDVNYKFDVEGSHLYIYFQGSKDIKADNGWIDWLRNFWFFPTKKKPYKGMVDKFYVHSGFLAAWKEVEDTIISEITKMVDGDYIRRDAFMNHPMFCASAVGDITEIIPPDTVDVLKNKDRYIESLKHWYLSDAFKRARERLGVIKHVYQGLLVVYFIENGSYELTEEQRKNVNIAHDKAEGADELCDWLIEKLKGM